MSRYPSDSSGPDGQETTWIFGYGSLIYKVDFPYLRKAAASIRGWERRFWQGSHDHRGTPCAPGRVVTLVRSAEALCKGVAYQVENSVLDHLDHREKNGYQRHRSEITLHTPERVINGAVYVAAEGNPAYLGPAPVADLAAHISRAVGPSGTNTDYVLQLAQALRHLGDEDSHVLALEALLLGKAAGIST